MNSHGQDRLSRSSIKHLHKIHNLQEALAAAEDSSRAKSQFLANMSHEMRTPLGIIIGFTELLLNEKPENDTKQITATIHRNSLHLLKLVDDLLDLAKVEAGQMKMEIAPFELKDELEIILRQFEPRARDKGIRLQINYDLQNPFCKPIYTDQFRFRQILLNLLSNSLKFTSQGTICVEVRTLLAAPGEVFAGGRSSLLCIDVIDTGEGIDPKDVHLLFQPFKQTEASTARMFGGTGLGLCLARGLAEALGGGVMLLRSEKGQGSTFRMTIDPGVELLTDCDDERRAESSEPRVFRELPSLEGLKILLVEDGLDNQVLIKKLLENIGADVECAEDGAAAIKRVTSGNYDVILMDIQLPVMDGYTATTQLRSRGFLVPIIALTAHALVEDRMKAQAGGFDDFISKPIDWFKLTEAILRCHDVNPIFH